MVLRQFITDLRTATDFFTDTNFIALINEFVGIAETAKAGTLTDWQTALDEQFRKIDEITLAYEAKNGIVLVENTYLNEADIGYVAYSYRDVVSELFRDIITADTQIRQLVEELNTFKAHSDQLRAALDTVGIEVSDQDKDDSRIAAFEFKQMSDISNLKELSSTARLLNIHLRSISKLDVNTPVKDIEIDILSKSSPLSVQAYVSKKVADALNKIIAGILENLKKIQELRLMQETIRQQKLDTKSKALDLALQKRRAGLEIEVIDKITKQLMRRFPEESSNGTRSEVEAGVEKAVEYFITQTTQGLEVRVIPSKTELQADPTGETTVRPYQEKLVQAEKILKLIPEIISPPERGEEQSDEQEE